MTTNSEGQNTDEFYIGYGKVPTAIKRFLLILIPVLALVILILGAVFPLIHDQFNSGKVNKAQEFEGLLLGQPVPHLLVPRPGDTSSQAPYSRYLLTGPGKTSPRSSVLDQVGKWVKLTGSPVYRNNLTVIAARSAEAIEPPSGAVKPDAGKSLGEFSLLGEILDSKCYPGVMKPGQTKTHRSCAIRCISGGVPPVFLVYNQQGDNLYLLLVDRQNQAINSRILDKVADPIRITGEVVQYGDMFVLKADPESYELVTQ